MEINRIYTENCIQTMERMSDNFIDLTIASPPYDKLRDYKGYSFDFDSISKQLFRVTSKGGVLVWIVSDQTIKGSETASSFKQALAFMNLGFRLYDTMFWEKESFSAPGGSVRYYNVVEYMFILTKGKPRTFNMIKDKVNIHHGKKIHGTERQSDGSTRACSGNGKPISKYGGRYNIWKINSDRTNLGHPAPFPEKLAADHIHSWSNEGDLVYDPFMGSGTTAKMAHLQKRNWIGSEISSEYVELANKRLEPVLSQFTIV